jgi:hypothetical protein
MRIAVMTDAHANLPALQAALNDVRLRGCDAVIHTGDAIAIGPQPAECVELLLSTPEAICLLGNHELWYLEGLPAPQPVWMSDGEVEHQHWTHAQLNQVPDWREAMLGWALTLERDYMGVRARFQHAPLRTTDGSREFTSIPRDADGAGVLRARSPRMGHTGQRALPERRSAGLLHTTFGALPDHQLRAQPVHS